MLESFIFFVMSLFSKNFLSSWFMRWLFSTNHKCGVLSFLVLEASMLYTDAVSVKLLAIRSKGDIRIKQAREVISISSLVNQIVKTISLFCWAGFYINPSIASGFYFNSLFCERKKLRKELINWCFTRKNKVFSQDLEETYWEFGLLRYGYKSVGAYLTRLGRYKKPIGFCNLERNKVPLSFLKKVFLTGKSEVFNQLKMHMGKYVNLTDVLASVELLQKAYQQINLGMMTKRLEDEVIMKQNYDWFNLTSKRLRDGSFQFRFAKRILIPKTNKSGEFRVLTISNTKDIIVQKAMAMILARIYEDKFLDTSYSSRVFRGIHSALETIRMNWSGISWFLKFDVKKCCENIDKFRLINILKEDIRDQRFFDLILKFFNVGPIGWKEKLGLTYLHNGRHVSVLFPIISNIYLHKFDLEVNAIMEEYKKGKPLRVFADVMKAEQQVPNVTHRILPSFIKVKYVRFFEKFLLGIAGSKDLVVKIRDRIQTFIKSNLKLTLIGGEIIHIAARKITFLGMIICAIPNSKMARRFGKMLEKKKRVKNRLLLQKKIRDERMLKVIRSTLIKTLKGNSKVKFPEVKARVMELKEYISSNDAFCKGFANIYRQFLSGVLSSFLFIPNNVKKEFKKVDSLLKEWEKNPRLLKKKARKSYKMPMERNNGLNLQINAPLKNLRFKLKQLGIISASNKPIAIGNLIHVSDVSIIKWYRAVGKGMLDYYKCCVNFRTVKSYANYMVRWSAIHTLAGKYKSSCKKIIAKHSNNLVITDKSGVVLAKYIDSQEIKDISRRFRRNMSKKAVDKTFTPLWAKSIRFNCFGAECAAFGCDSLKIEWHRVNKLARIIDFFGGGSVVTSKGRRNCGIEAFILSFNRKRIPLCKKHYIDLHGKKCCFSDIDWEYLMATT